MSRITELSQIASVITVNDSNRYLGIGTTNAQYQLDVNGDINFTGSFRQNGSTFTASRWTAGTGEDIYKLNGDVGIGTTNPTSKLHIVGDVNASSFSGSGSNLTGIVTYITAGSGITIDQSTGNVTINSTSTSSSSGSVIRKNDIVVGTGITILNFNGTAISSITSSSGIATITIPSSTRTINSYTASEGQTTFSATYTVGYVDVYLNGSKLSQSQYTATNGTSITLIEGTSLNDIIEIVSYNLILLYDEYSNIAGISTSVIGGIGSLTNLSVSGITTLGSSNGIGTVTVGVGNTALFVEGNARITGILSIGQGTITLDPNQNTVAIGTGIVFNANAGTIVVQGNQLTDTSGNANYTGVVTASSFVGNLTGTATTATNLADAANITTGTIDDARLPDLITSNINITSGISTFATVKATTFEGAVTGTATSTTNIPNLTGDVTSVNTTTTLATVNNNVGTYGSSTSIPSITVNAKGLVTGVTTSTITVGDGTLTLNVAGVGLTGSQTFTANQSGNATFIVASNATSTNTSSTLVARDASGSFSAGVITATSLTIGGNTVTTAGVGIRTSGGTVGTGVTLLDLRGAGISTVTVASGIGTINITGGGGGGGSTISTTAPTSPTDGQIWTNSNTGVSYIYYSASSTWFSQQMFEY